MGPGGQGVGVERDAKAASPSKCLKLDKSIDVDKAINWVASATEEALVDFEQRGKGRIFVATLGPGDLVYVPPCYCVAHTVARAEPFLGIRVGCLAVLTDMAVLERTIQIADSSGRPNDVAKAAFNILKSDGCFRHGVTAEIARRRNEAFSY